MEEPGLWIKELLDLTGAGEAELGAGAEWPHTSLGTCAVITLGLVDTRV